MYRRKLNSYWSTLNFSADKAMVSHYIYIYLTFDCFNLIGLCSDSKRYWKNYNEQHGLRELKCAHSSNLSDGKFSLKTSNKQIVKALLEHICIHLFFIGLRIYIMYFLSCSNWHSQKDSHKLHIDWKVGISYLISYLKGLYTKPWLLIFLYDLIYILHSMSIK